MTLTKAQRKEIVSQVVSAKRFREIAWTVFVIVIILNVTTLFVPPWSLFAQSFLFGLVASIILAIIGKWWVLVLLLGIAIFSEFRFQNIRNNAKVSLAGKPEDKKVN